MRTHWRSWIAATASSETFVGRQWRATGEPNSKIDRARAGQRKQPSGTGRCLGPGPVLDRARGNVGGARSASAGASAAFDEPQRHPDFCAVARARQTYQVVARHARNTLLYDIFSAQLAQPAGQSAGNAAQTADKVTLKRWLNEDVTYIITDEEPKAFKQLNTNEEREQFVEKFWLRRDPNPDTVENEYKEEVYRRIAYAKNISGRALRDRRPISAGSTLLSVRPMKSIHIPPVVPTKDRPRKAAEWAGRFLSKTGGIAL
jgi:hypothetical protein